MDNSNNKDFDSLLKIDFKIENYLICDQKVWVKVIEFMPRVEIV